MGLYQLIFSIFSLAVTACTSGVSLAVTRLVAEGNGVRPSVGRCMVLALLSSGLAGLVPVSYTHLDVYKRQISG